MVSDINEIGVSLTDFCTRILILTGKRSSEAKFR